MMFATLANIGILIPKSKPPVARDLDIILTVPLFHPRKKDCYNQELIAYPISKGFG